MKSMIVFSFLLTQVALAHNDCNFTDTPGLKDGNPYEVVINKDIPNRLFDEYKPQDMKNVPNEWLAPKVKGTSQALRKDALLAFSEMQKAITQEANVQLFVLSAFRSFESQCSNFYSKVQKWSVKFGSKEAGLAYTLKSVAEPGRSQHQLGTTVDVVFKSNGYKFAFNMTQTKEYKWMVANAHRFGFVLSYPLADDDNDGQGYSERTGYFYEPWHWRFIGVELATEFYEMNKETDQKANSLVMTLDEFLETKEK